MTDLEQQTLRNTLIAVFRDPNTGKNDLMAFLRSCCVIMYERFGGALEKVALGEQLQALYANDPEVNDVELSLLIAKLQAIRYKRFNGVTAIVFTDLVKNRKHTFTGAEAILIRQQLCGIPDDVDTVFLTVEKTPEIVESMLPTPSTLGALG